MLSNLDKNIQKEKMFRDIKSPVLHKNECF